MFRKTRVLAALVAVGGMTAALTSGEENKRTFKVADIEKVSSDDCEKGEKVTIYREVRERDTEPRWRVERMAAVPADREAIHLNEFQPSLRKASQLRGIPVTSFQGQDVGRIETLLIDLDRAQTAYGILSCRDLMGGGAKDIIVPWNAFHGSRDADRLLVSLDRRQCETAAAFDKDDLNDMQCAEDVHRHFGTSPYWLEARRAFDRQADSEMDLRASAGPGQLVSYSLLTGADVKGSDGKTLGEIEDLMIDMNRGQVAYLVLEHGGVGALGARYYPIPLAVCTVTTSDRECDVDCSETLVALQSKPSYGRDEWLAMSEDIEWNERTYRAYDREPYWVVYGYTIQREPAEFDATLDVLEREFNSEDVRPFEGKIVSIERVSGDRLQRERDWVMITVRMDADRRSHRPSVHPPKFRHPPYENVDAGARNDVIVRVYVAPETYLHGEDITLKRGERVLLQGCIMRLDGRNVMLPTQITCGTKTVILRDIDGSAQWTSTRLVPAETEYEFERGVTEFEIDRDNELEFESDDELEIEFDDDEIELEFEED